MDDSKPTRATDSPPKAEGPSSAAPPVKVKYLSDKLEEAELLLGYAAELGIDVKDETRDSVLRARVECDGGGVTEQTASSLLAALTSLAAAVRPVTVQSLRASANPTDARSTIQFYGTMAIVVGGIIMVFSVLTFLSSSVSERIRQDVDTANALASKLRAELGPSPSASPPAAGASAAAGLSQDQVWFGPGGPPPGLSGKDVISDLQQFAATMREIDGYARQLKYYVLDFENHEYARSKASAAPKTQAPLTSGSPLELLPGLDVPLSQELTEKVKEYQNVRNFGNSIQEKVTVYYGAIATCVLPVLYALLGAGAYLLRMFEDQIKSRTLISGDRHVARFLIAGIGGLVVGLFSNVTQGISFSPFAVAFLVGYAADVFFTFLEGLLQIFKRGAGKPGSEGAPPSPLG